MHTDKAFADALVRFGECAATAARRAADARGDEARLHRLTNNIRAMSRFFWFSIEFGLMRGPHDTLKAYGSGLLSSYGELAHAIESPGVRREPFDIGRVVNQPFEIDHYQPLLYVVDSFDHLYALADELEAEIEDGRLDDVAPGEPAVSEADLRSFVDASVDASAAQ
jgi:phenylalanine-4-hydroxylase